MISEKKVVQIDTGENSASAPNPPANKGLIIGECRLKLTKEFKPIVVRFFEKVDDELFAFSDKAVSSTLQELYFEAMRYIRKERETIERGYMNSVLRRYDDFWNPKIRPVTSIPQKPQELDEEDFSLVENEDLEEDLAIATLINKGVNLYHRDLYILNKRFAKLLGRNEVGNEENPVGPYRLGHAFADVLRPLTLELKIKLLLFKLFEKEVVSDLGIVYDEINETLVKHGVLPEIAKKVKKNADSTSNDNHRAGNKEPFNPDNAAYAQALQAMQTLLSTWRSQTGLTPLAASAGQPGVVVSDSREVIGTLSALQDPQFTTKFTEALKNGEDANLKLMITERLSQNGRERRTLAQMDEDIIDMIGMIFDFILEDRNLPDPVKVILGRLQIPIVKVAILDKAFFAKKSHPARQLLNQLAHAGIGLSGDEDLDHNPVFQQINAVVDRILNEFDQNVGFFEDLLQQFSQFMEQEGRRSTMMESRARQATQSKEHLLLAKHEVAKELGKRLQDRDIPPRIKRFLNSTWKDVLLLACLRKDKEPKAWRQKLQLTDTLIYSLLPPANDKERKRIIQCIPGMLRAVHRELENISFDPKQIAIFFKELKLHHHACLKGDNHSDVLDPVLDRELKAIAANLPEVDDLEVGDLTDIKEEDLEEEIILMTNEEDEQGDEFFEQAKSLEMGDWLELTDAKGKKVRAKLSWKSKVTGIRVFVNRRGMKVAEHTLHGLAAELRSGRAKPIEGKVPLMDRALSAMMTTLKHPAKMQGEEGQALSGGEILA